MWHNMNHLPSANHQRNFSTYPEKMRPLYQQAIHSFCDIASDKRFVNPNYINQPTENHYNTPGAIYEKCSKFINSSNGYPNNIRKEVVERTKSDPVDIKGKRGKSVHRSGRTIWHKPSLNMEIIEVDEVGFDVCRELNSPMYKTPPIECSKEIICKLNNSPMCIKIRTPVYFSVSPPRPLCYRRRKTSDCISEDSFVVFGGSSEDENDGRSDVEDTLDIEDEKECLDSNENLSKSAGSTDQDNLHGKNIKRVRFADDKNLVEIHHMFAWSFAYQACRKGHWEEYARDRERFKRRIENCETEITKILDTQHRLQIFQERFA